jgi:hypothetical protein
MQKYKNPSASTAKIKSLTFVIVENQTLTIKLLKLIINQFKLYKNKKPTGSDPEG